jgi:hypothetical protein
VRGLTASQRFWVYPNGMVVCINSVDSMDQVWVLTQEQKEEFNERYLPLPEGW